MKFISRVVYGQREETLARAVEAVGNHKVVVLENVDATLDWHAFYSELAERLGEIMPADENLETGENTGQQWIDITFDPAIQNRYRTAKAHQPLHTDGSYLDWGETLTFFYSRARAPLGGATVFLDTSTLLEAMRLEGLDDLLSDLYRVPVCFSKASQRVTRPILLEDKKGLNLNYNYYCLDEGNSAAAKELVEQFQAFLEKRVLPAGLVEAVVLNPGEAVVFHDFRLLHGRHAYFARDKGDRCLIKGIVRLP